MEKIYIEPEEIWGLCKSFNDDSSDQMMLLAESRAFGIEIWLHYNKASCCSEIGVLVDGESIFNEAIMSEKDCDDVSKRVYRQYLTSYFDIDDFGPMLGSEDKRVIPMSEQEQNKAIDDREYELDDAMFFLLEALDQDIHDKLKDIDGVYERLKDVICGTLYKEFDISIYRPMILEDEDGKDCYSEFPYEEIDID